MRLNEIVKYTKEETNYDLNNMINKYLTSKNIDTLEFKKIYMRERMNKVREQYNQKIDFSVDFLNQLFQKFSHILINDFKSDDPDFVNKNKDIIIPKIQKLDLNKKAAAKRKENHDKAVEISKTNIAREFEREFFDNLTIKSRKFKNKDPEYEKPYSAVRGASRIIGLGSSYNLVELKTQDVTKRTQIFFHILKQAKQATRLFAQDLNDTDFLDIAEEAGRYMQIIPDLEKGTINDILKELGISENDMTPEQKQELEDWKNKDSKAALDISEQYQNRLDIIANPYYLEMSEDDMTKTTYVMQKLLNNSEVTHYLNDEGYPVQMDETNSESKLSPLLHLNNAYSMKKSIFKSSMELDEKQKNFQTEQITEMLKSKFNILNEGVYFNKLNEYAYYDFDKNDYISKEEMIKGIIEGKKYAIVDRTDTSIPNIVGDIDAGTKEPNIRIHIPPMTKIRGHESQELKNTLLKNLKEANSWTIFTTNEFDKLADSVNKMIKSTTEEDFNRHADEAVKWAKAYLDNKEFSTKKKTAKTNQRIIFAQLIYNNFRLKTKMNEFEAEEFKPLLAQDKEILDLYKDKDFADVAEEVTEFVTDVLSTGEFFNIQDEGIEQRARAIESICTLEKLHKLHLQGDPKQFSKNEILNEEKAIREIRNTLADYGYDLRTLDRFLKKPLKTVFEENLRYTSGNYDLDADFKVDQKMGVNPFIETNSIKFEKPIKNEKEVLSDADIKKKIKEEPKKVIEAEIYGELQNNNVDIYKGVIESEPITEDIDNNEKLDPKEKENLKNILTNAQDMILEKKDDIEDLEFDRDQNLYDLKECDSKKELEDALKENEKTRNEFYEKRDKVYEAMSPIYQEIYEVTEKVNNIQMEEEHLLDFESELDKEFEFDTRANNEFDQKLKIQEQDFNNGKIKEMNFNEDKEDTFHENLKKLFEEQEKNVEKQQERKITDLNNKMDVKAGK